MCAGRGWRRPESGPWQRGPATDWVAVVLRVLSGAALAVQLALLLLLLWHGRT